MITAVGDIIKYLPGHRRIDAAKIALEVLTAEQYEALLLELDWIDYCAIENLRKDLDYWKDEAKTAEKALDDIKAILAAAGVECS